MQTINIAKRLFILWAPLVWACVILWATTTPHSSMPDLRFTYADKIFHFIAFLALSMLLYGSLSRHGNILLRKFIFFFTFIPCSLYGAFTEALQFLVPFRDVSIYDLVSNVSGALSGFYLAKAVHGGSKTV